MLQALARHPPLDLAWYGYRVVRSRLWDAPNLPPPVVRLATPVCDGTVTPHPDTPDLLLRRFRIFGGASRDCRAEAVEPGHAWGDALPESLAALVAKPRTEAVDWHLDPVSGHRWDLRPSSQIRIGDPSGVDIKAPWEFGRLQGLPIMARAWDPAEGRALADGVIELLSDFVAWNPPGRGIHWRSGLEVALRAHNVGLSLDIVRAKGYEMSRDLERSCAMVLALHGRFLTRHLSWVPRGRNNHYLGEILGLATVGAWLEGAEPATWVAYAGQELSAECRYQFLPDGGSFEGSTTYHGFAAELLIWGAVLVDHAWRRGGTPLPFSPGGAPRLQAETRAAWAGRVASSAFDRSFWERVSRTGDFLAGIRAGNGEVPQVGDNDSGRLTKIGVLHRREGQGTVEALLDYSAVERAVALARGEALDRDIPTVMRALEHSGTVLMPAVPPPRHSVTIENQRIDGRTTTVFHTEADLWDGLDHRWFADFGLVVLRSTHLFLTVRCPGRRSRHPRGGHLHADELAITMRIAGAPVVLDSGTGCYTSDAASRNRFRNRSAHWTPLPDVSYPTGMGGLFVSPRLADCRVAHCDAKLVEVEADWGGRRYRRQVRIERNAVVVIDEPSGRLFDSDPEAWRRAYSPRYGSVISLS